ncbi:HNH endonuclease, partial [Candidatus Babeliales bacterium]|nr:HNH endonuclease [Candidatus Babeliales bacterium]
TKGEKAKVSDCDYDEIIGMGKWQLSKQKKSITMYAIRSIQAGGKTKAGWYKKKTIRMHHVVMPPKEGFVIDHINRDGLDNRRENLRYVSKSQNQANRAVNRGKKLSKYKGVTRYRDSGGWGSLICLDKKLNFLGVYKTEEDAARAYNIKAKELFGEYALLNDVDMSKPAEKNKVDYSFLEVPYYDEKSGIQFKSRKEYNEHRTKNKKKTSKYRGVSFCKRTEKWRVSVETSINGKRKSSSGGYHKDEDQAALAYNKKAKEILKDKAILNNIAGTTR